MDKVSYLAVFDGKNTLKFNSWKDWFEYRRIFESDFGKFDESKLSYFRVDVYNYSQKFVNSQNSKYYGEN